MITDTAIADWRGTCLLGRMAGSSAGVPVRTSPGSGWAYSGGETRIRPAASPLAGNIDSPVVAAVFLGCAIAYLGIYAVEAPLRFLLYLFGKDSLILLRDGLI